MELKFYLNKLVKVDKIEDYTIKSLKELKNKYQKFLDGTEGRDPDFPMMSFKGHQGLTIKGKNIYSGYDEDNPDPNFKGLSDLANMDMTKQEPQVMHLDEIRRLNNRNRNKK